MAKPKTLYACTACGSTTPQWAGQCRSCQAWDTLEEQLISPDVEANNPRVRNYAGSTGAVTLDNIEQQPEQRLASQIQELDRVRRRRSRRLGHLTRWRPRHRQIYTTATGPIRINSTGQ